MMISLHATVSQDCIFTFQGTIVAYPIAIV